MSNNMCGYDTEKHMEIKLKCVIKWDAQCRHLLVVVPFDRHFD